MLTFGNGEEPGAVGAADAAAPAGEGGGGVEQLAACRTAAPQEQTRWRNPSSCFLGPARVWRRGRTGAGRDGLWDKQRRPRLLNRPARLVPPEPRRPGRPAGGSARGIGGWRCAEAALGWESGGWGAVPVSGGRRAAVRLWLRHGLLGKDEMKGNRGDCVGSRGGLGQCIDGIWLTTYFWDSNLNNHFV
jgi:hypothetical protein